MTIHALDNLRQWWLAHEPASSMRRLRRRIDERSAFASGNGQDHGPALQLHYPSTTLGGVLDQTADRFGDVPAILFGGATMTYRQVQAQVNRVAGGLAAMGVRRGDAVVLTLPNCPEFVTAFFGTLKLGAVVVNAGPLISGAELETIVRQTEARVLIGLDLLADRSQASAAAAGIVQFIWCTLEPYQSLVRKPAYRLKVLRLRHDAHAMHHTLAELLDDAPARPPTLSPGRDDVAVLQPTGGTTGGVKLAQLTHRSLLANATQIIDRVVPRHGQERMFAGLPMFHVYGLTTGLVTGVLSGATLLPVARFNGRQALQLIDRDRPTILPLVPAMAHALCDEMQRRGRRGPFPDLRLCTSGAAPLSEELAARFGDLVGLPLIQGYGLTEASPVTHLNPLDAPRELSIGLPLADTQMRIADLDDPTRDVPPGEPGELWVTGPQLMLGYHRDAPQTDAALVRDRRGVFWLRTGDIARCDHDGYTFIIDRLKDMINHAGLKIYPARVEAVLLEHAQVAQAAVIGQPDPVVTEQVAAFVVPREPTAVGDATAALIDELLTLCRSRLAPYEVPKIITVVESLPYTGLGKLLRRELRDRASDRGEDLSGNGDGKEHHHGRTDQS